MSKLDLSRSKHRKPLGPKAKLFLKFIVLTPLGIWVLVYAVWIAFRWLTGVVDLEATTVAWSAVGTYFICGLLQLPQILNIVRYARE